MALENSSVDAAEYIEDDEAVAELSRRGNEDLRWKIPIHLFLAVALGTVARARGMSQIARRRVFPARVYTKLWDRKAIRSLEPC